MLNKTRNVFFDKNLENIVFSIFAMWKAFFRMLRRFFWSFLRRMIFIISPLSLLLSSSLPLYVVFSPSLPLPHLFFSPLRFLLWPFLSLFCFVAAVVAASAAACCCRKLLLLLLVAAAGAALVLVSEQFFVISACVLCHSGHFWVVVRCTLLRDASRACEPVITMMMMIVQAVFDFSFGPLRVGTFVPWTLTGQCKTLLSCVSGSRRAENHAKCVQRDQTGRRTARFKHLRRDAADQSRSLKQRRMFWTRSKRSWPRRRGRLWAYSVGTAHWTYRARRCGASYSKISKLGAWSPSVHRDWRLNTAWQDWTFAVTCCSVWACSRFVANGIWSPWTTISSTACGILKHGPKSLTVGQVFFVGAKPASVLKAPAWPRHRPLIVILRVVCARALMDGRRRHILEEYTKLQKLEGQEVKILGVGAGFIGVEWVTELEYFFLQMKLTIVDYLPRCLGPLPDR